MTPRQITKKLSVHLPLPSTWNPMWLTNRLLQAQCHQHDGHPARVSVSSMSDSRLMPDQLRVSQVFFSTRPSAIGCTSSCRLPLQRAPSSTCCLRTSPGDAPSEATDLRALPRWLFPGFPRWLSKSVWLLLSSAPRNYLGYHVAGSNRG